MNKNIFFSPIPNKRKENTIASSINTFSQNLPNKFVQAR